MDLKSVLEKHSLWLNGVEGGERASLRRADLRVTDLCGANLCGADLCGAKLRGANLRGANLCGANLYEADLCGANLRGANLRGADLNFSAWPLWCGSLNAKIDTRIAVQLLYHLMRTVQASPEVSNELKAALFTDALVAQANLFHRVGECGRIVI